MMKKENGRKKAQRTQMSEAGSKHILSFSKLMCSLRLFAAILFSPLAFTRVAAGQEQQHHHHDHAVTEPATTSAHIPPAPPSHVMGPMSAAEMAEIMAMDDAARFGSIAIDRLEWREGSDVIGWEGTAWYGGDYNRLMLKSEGDRSDESTHTRTELLWDRIVARWWSVQAGIRHDAGDGPSRTWAALGVDGLAPYWIDVEATFYVGDSGRTALRVEASHDMRITQRLILQPQVEFNAYGKDDVERGLGSGLSDLEAGLRLRYEIRREFAPYVGVHWKHRFGETADFAGEDSESEFVAGLRVWF